MQLNASLQKVLKLKKLFMDDDAMMKVICLNTHRIASKWTMLCVNEAWRWVSWQ